MKIKTIKYTNNLLLLAITILLAFILLSYSPMGNAQSMSWSAWVQQLRQDAIAQGIQPNVFDQAFANISGPDQQILFFNRTQPEKRISFMDYRNTRIDPLRIRMGRMEYLGHQQLLNQIGRDYGVDACTVAAIWGIETSYGHYMGTFPVITSLSTLAYDSSRPDYFRSELLIALHILNEGDVSLQNFKGEWAGASGIPQFMPSSWQQYAVDYDHDGRKDIWQSLSDGLASIGNYLSMNGWQANEPSAIEVSLPSGFDENLLGIDTVKSVSEWSNLGVAPASGFSLPTENLNASIVQPNGGPALMAFNNFKVIMKYNNSIFYAGSVGYLADKICGRQ